MESAPRRILTVSQVTAALRSAIEQQFTDIWLEGEVSNLRAPGSGHVYFTLKDESCQLRAVLFRTTAQRIRFELKEGLCLIVRGRLSVYEPRGEYQIILDYAEPKGVGALQLAFEQLKDRLAHEGWFAAARKRPLPFYPRRVGVVTSPTGAAIRDILKVMARRCPTLNVRIHPVPVQGDGAAPLIAAAIAELGQSGEVDVLIVGRGGGSMEDLWCFNDERVVRAIGTCSVPVVSAVGHEIDVTLADLAADYRAPTPSAAAEAVAPMLEDVLAGIQDLWSRQERALRNRVRLIQHELSHCCRALPIMMVQIQRRMQRVDESVSRLTKAGPLVRVRHALVLLPQLLKRLEHGMAASLSARRHALRRSAEILNGLSPLNVLARGYAVLETLPDRRVVQRAHDVKAGQRIQARLSDGRLICDVRDIVPESS